MYSLLNRCFGDKSMPQQIEDNPYYQEEEEENETLAMNDGAEDLEDDHDDNDDVEASDDNTCETEDNKDTGFEDIENSKENFEGQGQKNGHHGDEDQNEVNGACGGEEDIQDFKNLSLKEKVSKKRA